MGAPDHPHQLLLQFGGDWPTKTNLLDYLQSFSLGDATKLLTSVLTPLFQRFKAGYPYYFFTLFNDGHGQSVTQH
jgi:hypothetical protein